MQRTDETDYDIYDANYTWQPKLMQAGGVNGLIPGGATKQDEQCSRTPVKFTKVHGSEAPGSFVQAGYSRSSLVTAGEQSGAQ